MFILYILYSKYINNLQIRVNDHIIDINQKKNGNTSKIIQINE